MSDEHKLGFYGITVCAILLAMMMLLTRSCHSELEQAQTERARIQAQRPAAEAKP